ncbi:MAG: hypothetical protein ACLFSY_01760 [Desulfonatronovibrionaceae bacterium]
MGKEVAVFTLTVVLLFVGAFAFAAEGPDEEKQDEPQVQMTLEKYKSEGYSVLGPVQYLGRSTRVINLYRHDPLKYSRLEIIAEDGTRTAVQKYDRVYVLSKGEHVVLVRMQDQGGNNV